MQKPRQNFTGCNILLTQDENESEPSYKPHMDTCAVSDKRKCEIMFANDWDLDTSLPHHGDLTDDFIIKQIYPGGKSSAIVLKVMYKTQEESPLHGYKIKAGPFVLKVYLDAFDNGGNVYNERAFRDLYTQCMLSGERGFTCLKCMGTAPWPAAWVNTVREHYTDDYADNMISGKTDRLTSIIINGRDLPEGPPPSKVVFMLYTIAEKVPLMDLDLASLDAGQHIGCLLEITAVWQKAVRVFGDNFTHWDLHPDNIFIDFGNKRRENLPFSHRIGKSVEAVFPTVTIIDFDLAASDVFPNKLPEHKAKKRSAIGISERAIQWTIKWLGIQGALFWFSFLMFLRNIPFLGKKIHPDKFHLLTYQFVFSLYYFQNIEQNTTVGTLVTDHVSFFLKHWQIVLDPLGIVRELLTKGSQTLVDVDKMKAAFSDIDFSGLITTPISVAAMKMLETLEEIGFLNGSSIAELGFGTDKTIGGTFAAVYNDLMGKIMKVYACVSNVKVAEVTTAIESGEVDVGEDLLLFAVFRSIDDLGSLRKIFSWENEAG